MPSMVGSVTSFVARIERSWNGDEIEKIVDILTCFLSVEGFSLRGDVVEDVDVLTWLLWKLNLGL